MAVPTTRFRNIPLTTATTAIDTPAERLASISGQTIVSTGAGNEWDFGSLSIAGGANDTLVKTCLWDVTASGGNTLVNDFRIYVTEGFDQAATLVKFRALSGADNASPSLTQNYVANAVIGSYTWGNIPTSLPGSINLYPTDEGSSMVVTTTSDDVVMFASYVAVAAAETTGTYKGLDAGYEFRYSFRFTYS